MKISELIKTLEYELESTGDSDINVCLDVTHDSVVINDEFMVSEDLCTCLDVGEDGKCTFLIQTR